jgi:hypothetical protein
MLSLIELTDPPREIFNLVALSAKASLQIEAKECLKVYLL